MKIQIVIATVIATIFFSCGSSERVISNEGKVYEVKGNTFYNNDVDVTDKLSSIEKQRIQSSLEKRLKAEKEAAEKQEEIKESLKELRQREKGLKEKQKELKDKIEKREEARDNFFDVRNNLNDVKEDYQQLKDKGGLSLNDEAKWEKRLKKLEQKLKELELKINN